MDEEHVYVVDGAVAHSAEPISLAEAGFTERSHLQEWVIAHPEMLGEGVMVLTSEFDRWVSSAGPSPLDRLDVLGLGRDGRLVVAELKRDSAPEMVEMQAIKYAAMASRFTLDDLALAHAAFSTKRNEPLAGDQAAELISDHAGYSISPDTLRAPRIVLLANSFPTTVKASAVWLSEMGVDIALVQLQAYRSGDGIVVSVSQLYPVKDVEEFAVGPATVGRTGTKPSAFPILPWTADELTRLLDESDNVTVAAMVDLCAERAGECVSLSDLEDRAGRTLAQARADLAQLTGIAKRVFGRQNWPVEVVWGGAGDGRASYRMNPTLANEWRETLPTDFR